MSDILALAQAHGHGPFKKEGVEHRRPCFECGGKDRFWINPSGGKQNTGRYACRQCDISGNAVEYAVNFCGLTWEEAYDALGLQYSGRKHHTVELLAQQKKLPADFLRFLGIR